MDHSLRERFERIVYGFPCEGEASNDFRREAEARFKEFHPEPHKSREWQWLEQLERAHA